MSSSRLFVLIPVLAGAEGLQRCWEALANQACFDQCLVTMLVAGGSEAAGFCGDAQRKSGNVTLVSGAWSTKTDALNTGLATIADQQGNSYVTFLDPDEWWEPGYLRSSLSMMEGAPDAIVGRVRGLKDEAAAGLSASAGEDASWLTGVTERPRLLLDANRAGKIFRTSLIRRHGLTFPELSQSPDLWFVPEALSRASGIVVNPEALSHWSGSSGRSLTFPRTEKDCQASLSDVRHLLDLRDALPPELSAVLDELVIREHGPFVESARAIMDEGSLRSYCVEAVELFSRIPTKQFFDLDIPWVRRRQYLALASGDLVRARRRAPALDETEIFDGAIQYGGRVAAACGQGDPCAPNQSVSLWFRAWLGYLDKGEKGVTLHGHVRVPGVALDVPASNILPALRIAEQTYVGIWTQRGDALASDDPDQQWSGFAVRLPACASGLPFGRHALTLVLVDAADRKNEATCALQANGGLLREARLLALRDRNVVPVTDESNWVELLVGPRRKVGNTLIWRVARTRGALKQRQSFARLKLAATILSVVPSRPVWLFAEREDTAQDNSAAFFRYVRKNHRASVAAYYVIDADAKQRDRVADLGHVVDRGSLKHVLLMLRARVLISGFDIDRYLLPPQWKPDVYRRHLAWFLGTPRVFLNHGVSYTDVSQVLARRYYGVSLFVTSGKAEAEYARAHMDYTDEIITPGLARFDLLQRRTVTPRRILFMPTWRGYLKVGPPGSQEHDDFLESTYWSFISSFLKSPELAATLDRDNLVLEVYPHYEVAALLSAAIESNGRIVVADQSERAVRAALGEASLFITDWTSVVFDAAYLGLPVIHAPFDEDEFLTRHYRPGFFEFKRDAFGPVVREPDALVEAIEHYAAGGFVREAVYTQRADDFFAKRGGHSVATYEAIQEMLRRRK